MEFFDSLQVFYGEATAARARVYARAARRPEHAGCRLTGRITGPHSALGATLSATVPLRDLGPGATLLAEAVLPDPCFWSPDSPASYEVEVTLHDADGQTLATATRHLGMRALGARGASFYLEGKRWVVRGVDRRCDPTASVEAWRVAWAALLVTSPDEELCRQASEQGVLVVAWITGTSEDAVAELDRLSHWPAVGMAVIDCQEPCDQASLTAAAPNILLGQTWRGQSAIPSWVQFLVAEAEPPATFGDQLTQVGRPVVALRRLDGRAAVQQARAACDDLQRDLAPLGDWAGYVTLAARQEE